MYNVNTSSAEYATHAKLYKHILLLVRRKSTDVNLVGAVAAVAALLCLLGIHDQNYTNIRLPLYLIVVIWVLVRPRMALYLLPFAISWGSLDTGSSGLNARGYDADLLVGLLAVSWLMSFTLRSFVVIGRRFLGPLDREKSQMPAYVFISILLLLFAMLISMLAAVNFSSSIKEIIKWLELLVLIIIGSQYIRTRRQIWILVLMICLAASSQAILGYEQNFLSLGPASFIRSDTLRVYGTLNQPNPFAGYINMALAITLALTLLSKTVKIRILAGATSLLLGGVEYYTQSKGGWLAVGVATLFIIIAGLPHLRVVITAAGIAALTISAGFLTGVFPERLIIPLLSRIGVLNISFTVPTTANYANSERVAHWYAGIRMFLDHPLIGAGIGNYGDAYAKYAPGIFTISLGHAHNYYINIAAEAGLLGFTTFVLFLSAVFVAGSRVLQHINTDYQHAKVQLVKSEVGQTLLERQTHLQYVNMLANDRALAIGLFAAIISVCMHNMVDNLYVHGMTSLFALLILLLLQLDRKPRSLQKPLLEGSTGVSLPEIEIPPGFSSPSSQATGSSAYKMLLRTFQKS